MDLVSLLRVALRRWVILVPMLGLTVGCAFVLASSVEPDYEANATVLLIGTSNRTNTADVNPLEDLRPLNITAQALAIIMSDESVRQDLASGGNVASYAVNVQPDTPILRISARGGTPAAALGSRDALVDLLRNSLDAQQRSIDAPADTFIRAQTISTSAQARPINAARDRALVGVLALGAIASIAAAVMLDQLLSHRAGRPKRGRVAPRRDSIAEAPAVADSTATILLPPTDLLQVDDPIVDPGANDRVGDGVRSESVAGAHEP